VSPADVLRRPLHQLLPWAVLAFVLGGGISWIRRPGDFAGYLLVGDLALAGEDIYGPGALGLNTWPPFFSLLCVPLALLARPTPYLARGVWLALNFVLLWAILKTLARLVYHTELRLQPHGADLSLASPEILIPVVLCYRLLLGNFDHLQVNIVIFTFALLGVYWHTRGHDRAGGVALGLAAALKIMPVVFVPYFLYRRRYRMAVSAGVVTLAFSLSPILVYGWSRFLGYVAAWRHAIDVGWGVGRMNQSVYAMFDRYIGHGVTPFNAAVENMIPESGDPCVAVATGAVLALIMIAALLLFRGQHAADAPVTLIEYSVAFIVSALFGPLAWKAYLVVLLCPCMLLTKLLRDGTLGDTERRVVVSALAVYFVLAGLATPGLLGKRLAGTLEMLSNTTLGTLVVLKTLFWLRWRLAYGASSTTAAAEG